MNHFTKQSASFSSAIHWQESETAFRENLLLHGNSYRVESLFDTEPMQTNVTMVREGDPRARFSPSRHFCYLRRILPAGASLVTASGARRGKVSWTSHITIPVLAAAKPVGNSVVDLNLHAWMSLTPMEFFTLRGGIERAEGDVMVGGLGLGWFLGRVCARAAVRRVRVVDLQPEIIEWLRPAIEAAYPAVLTKEVEWVAGSAWDHIDCYGPETRNLIDIWPEYDGSLRDPMVDEVRRSRSPKHFWCWGEDARGTDRKPG